MVYRRFSFLEDTFFARNPKIYINDLPFALKKGKVMMYADDTSISYSSSSLVDIEQTLNSELNDLKLWMQGNKLSLNVLKTQAMVEGSQPKIKKITVDHPQFLLVALKLKMLTEQNAWV